ncbi:ferrochelatase [Coralloluteibacterium thermophilus]|uniref:Ferrochelatase n=1 Tax=Coralloluteibacterium thermophilum TaxID=2707049 RepID=A0ABV9NMN7_9GAMM
MSQSGTAVLLVNLGTPDAPTAPAVRRYLGEFLHDYRVVDLSRWVWCPVLHGAILPLRSPRVAKKYAEIWREDGSPLLALSTGLARAVAAELPGAAVRLAMRYGNPSVPDVLRALREAGMRRLLVLPLYPQYSQSTAASVLDRIAREFRRWPWVPDLRFVGDYHLLPAWLDAVAASIADWRAREGAGERLLFSYHGLPQRFADAGDPYPQQCEASSRAVAERLGLDAQDWRLTYQSRFGREAWLEPATDATLVELAKAGVRNVDVVCPGFAVDCLETLEEIAMQNAELFREAGGERLRYIPALNDSPAHAAALAGLLRREGAGWPGL